MDEDYDFESDREIPAEDDAYETAPPGEDEKWPLFV